MENKKVDEILEILENITYTEVLLCLISGKNYSTSIAKVLGKKQPTVTEQLNKLYELGLIFLKERKKAKIFEVNWDLLIRIFYDIINETLELRGEYISKEDLNKIKNCDLKKVIPPKLIKDFLREYYFTLNELGGKKKGFDEIIFSFFAAINNLEEEHWNRLIKLFKINGEILKVISNLMEFEIAGIEKVAIETYLDLGDKNE